MNNLGSGNWTVERLQDMPGEDNKWHTAVLYKNEVIVYGKEGM